MTIISFIKSKSTYIDNDDIDELFL